MNKNILKLMMVFFAIFAFNACSDDDEIEFTAQTPPDQISFTNDFLSEYLLSSQIAQNNAERFTWESPDFGVPTPITYQLEGSIDFEFTEPVGLAETSNQQASVSVGQLLNLAEAAGLDNDEETENPDSGDLFFRVRALIGSENAENSPETISEITTLTVTLIAAGGEEPVIPLMSVPGEHQDNQYDPPSAPLVAASDVGNVDYEGFMYLEGNFKFVEPDADGVFSYDNTDYGMGEEEGTLEVSGPDIVAEAGYYLVRANTDALTYNLTETNWGIIGAATPNGWDESTPMTYNAETKKFEIEITLTADAFKFRANDSWDINLGGDPNNLNFGGDDLINENGGTYLVELDLSNPRMYSYTLTEI
ncbi:SusE domain-containing protein [Psychroflexus montanilacus]|uniref:SusE domain-containing protein n=1 Tax=Psychroflexus montanilacus TaxID=2873598 RepID=UPI001CCD7A80|nr:SusE domain-containing protein [Psychroflexus montanilacus]MBZ9653053.1 SusE domain-containing protein [Psychroflexus montanilacus]